MLGSAPLGSVAVGGSAIGEEIGPISSPAFQTNAFQTGAFQQSLVADLAVVEPADSAALVVSVFDAADADLYFSISEAEDVVAATVAVRSDIALSAPEVADAAEFTLQSREISFVELAVTEASDTLYLGVSVLRPALQFGAFQIDAYQVTSAEREMAVVAVDSPDTAAFTVGIRNFLEVAAIEEPDVYNIQAATISAFDLNAVEDFAPDSIAVELDITSPRLDIEVTEPADTAALMASVGSEIALATTENPDAFAIEAQVISSFSLAVSEVGDTIAATAEVLTQLALAAVESNDTYFARVFTDDFFTEGAETLYIRNENRTIFVAPEDRTMVVPSSADIVQFPERRYETVEPRRRAG